VSQICDTIGVTGVTPIVSHICDTIGVTGSKINEVSTCEKFPSRSFIPSYLVEHKYTSSIVYVSSSLV